MSMLCSVPVWKLNQYAHGKEKIGTSLRSGMITMVLREKGSREPSLVRVYHLSVEWGLLSISSEFTPHSFEAEVFFQNNFEYMSIDVHWYYD